MIVKQETQPPDGTPAYDSKALADALMVLSQSEIESMLVHIAGLETYLLKLDTAGRDDAMMRRVTDGLRLLTYLLDAVQRHKDDAGESR